MIDRVKCVNADCNSMILLSTAEKNAGQCMPCVKKREQQAYRDYIKANRKEIDLYAGVDDGAEIIKIMYRIWRQRRDPLIDYIDYSGNLLALYQSLTIKQINTLIKFIKQQLQVSDDVLTDIALPLSVFAQADLSELYDIMIDNEQFYPPMLFRQADDHVAACLLTVLQQQAPEKNLSFINHLLCALVWVNSARVTTYFNQMRISRPEWAKVLFIPPEQYSLEAGWLLDQSGQRQQLYLDTCYPLLAISPEDQQSVDEDNTFQCWSTIQEKCHYCHGALVNLFDIDLSQSTFSFLPFNGPRLTVTTCLICGEHDAPVYFEIMASGESRWSSYNQPNKQGQYYERTIDKKLVLAAKPRPAYFSADEFLPITFSQLGGMPTWIQDSAYPDCPKCHSKMLFIGQISCEDIMQCGEGIYYALICPDCRISTTVYQQT